MKLMKMTGGLGNQMFIYAFYLQMQKRFSDTYIDFSEICNKHEHNGFELNTVFDVNARYIKWPVWLKKILKFLFFKEIDERKENLKTTKVFQKKYLWPFIYYKGFYQSEYCFKEAEPEVRKAFCFKMEKVNDYSRRMAKEIEQNPHAVSFHVRRGDYLRPKFYKRFGSVCQLSYYQEAAKRILDIDPEAMFYVFSDDTEWVTENIKLPAVRIIDGNRGKDSWQDMMLMSICRHHVISNSTFSWWAAYLDNKKDKTVIAPEKWFGDCDMPYVIPEDWIRISSQKD